MKDEKDYKAIGKAIVKEVIKDNYTITQLKKLHHKAGVKPEDWDDVHPRLLLIAKYLLDHCYAHKLPITITSIIRPKIKGVSKTDIHSSGRAFDISVKGWSNNDIAYLCLVMNDDLRVGAISKSDSVEREVIYEDGNTQGLGAHLHFQCRK